MMTKAENERRDIEALLPWHAAGTLSRRDAQRVETAIKSDADLARQFALVREELAETIHLNETLGAPSARAMERVLAGIEAEGAKGRKPRFSFDIAAFIAERLTLFSPRTLAWSATAAVLAIVLQAGLLAGLYVGDKDRPLTPGLASYPEEVAPAAGEYALIRFAPQASVVDVTKILENYKAVVVDGPKAGGVYTVRVSMTGMPKSELDKLLKRIEADSQLLRVIGTTKPAQ